MAKEKKKGRGKKALKIIGIILAVIVLFFVVTGIVSYIGNRSNMKKAQSFAPVEYSEDRIVPEKDENGNWTFTADRDLKVLQLTDVHLGGGWLSLKKDAMALNAVAAMITAEKPDLVIATGDIAYPVPFQSGTINNKTPAKIFAELMDTLGVYWTLGFGNHDTEAYSFYSREDISAFYEADDSGFCLFSAGPADIDGFGNQVITVKNSDGVYTQLLFVFDSGSYVDNDYFGALWKYDNIHENQIEWYKQNVENYSKMNVASGTEGDDADHAEPVKSLCFFHIPTEEFRTAWTEYVENGFKDTADTKYVYGTAGETGKVVFCGLYENDFFETCLELGSTQGIFCGHDHKNNFSLDYKGIRLTYGRSIDYLAYIGISKLGAQRGCTVITVGTDGGFEVTPESYYQDKYISLYEKEAVTMQEVEPVTVFE